MAATISDAAVEAFPFGRLPGTALRDLIDRMTELPSLAGRYRELGDPERLALEDLPVLTKTEFRQAFPDVLARARDRPHGSLVLGSGGTTEEPQLSLIPSGQYIDAIRERWSPLAARDVVVHLDEPGKLSSSHNFFIALAHAAGAVSLPLGAVPEPDLARWLDFAERWGATVFSGTPSQFARIAEFCTATGRRPPAIHSLLWNGEAFGARALRAVRDGFADVKLYGIYGSTETWVIGHNGPVCAPDTFHVLPYQHVELVDGRVLVTNLHPECLNPVVRYRIGDRGEAVKCRCGRAEPALRVLGRDDQQVKFLTILFTPQEVRDAAFADPAVADVQIALFGHGSPGEHIELRLRLHPDADRADAARRVRETVLTKVYRLGFEVAADPAAFTVRVVDRFSVNPRSNKTPLLVKDDPVG